MELTPVTISVTGGRSCWNCGELHTVLVPSRRKIAINSATCPNCGSLLWFLNLPSQPRVFERSRSRGIRDRVIAIVAEQLGVDPEKITQRTSLVNDLGADSLDTVELIMQLEEELNLQ